METIVFDGQQTDERVLAVIKPHLFPMYLAIATLVLLAIFFFFVLHLIAGVAPSLLGLFFTVAAFIFPVLLLSGGVWWNYTVFTKSKTYITDRRILRFEVMTPFFTTKRALFWNEALKAKGYATNIIWKMLKIGVVQVEPHLTEHEDVVVKDVFMYDDLANYIDKILFTFKNKPTEVAQIKPFIPKPRGLRDTT